MVIWRKKRGKEKEKKKKKGKGREKKKYFIMQVIVALTYYINCFIQMYYCTMIEIM